MKLNPFYVPYEININTVVIQRGHNLGYGMPAYTMPRPWHTRVHATEAMACPVGRLPRPWHALEPPQRLGQHLGDTVLPKPNNLFRHILLFSP